MNDSPSLRARLRVRAGVGSGTVLLCVPVAIVAVVADLAFSESLQSVVITGLIYLVAVLGLGAFWGNSGIMSLGHVAFLALGAYVGGILTLDTETKASALPHLPTFLRNHALGMAPTLLIVAVVVAIVAALLGAPLLRIAGAAFVIASYGALVIVNVVLNAATSFTRGAQSFYGLSGDLSMWTALAAALVAIVAVRVLRESSLGLQVRAARENELAARASGIEVGRRRLQMWVLSVIPCGVAGFFLGVFLSAFSPDTFYLSMTVTLVAMVLVGGLGTVTGAVVGTAMVTILLQVLQYLENGFSLGGLHIGAIEGLPQIGLGVAILITLYLRPNGLTGTREIDEILCNPSERHRPASAATAPAKPGEPQATAPAERPAGAALNARGISKQFAGVSALSEVSISIARGQIAGLIGPNGSGKTTLLNILSSVQKPTAGRVLLDDRDITGLRPHCVARAGVGRTFQNIRLFGDLTVLQNVRIAAGAGRLKSRGCERRAWQLLDEMGIPEHAFRLSRTLPYGDQRRLEITRALAGRPKYLLLDEPAAGMNEIEAERLSRRITAIRDRYDVGVLVVDHSVNMMMKLCEHITVLNEGRVIASGTPAEVRSDPAVIEAYLGVRAAREHPTSSITEGT